MIQIPLFEMDSLIRDNSLTNAEIKNSKKNKDAAFGITKVSLRKGAYNVLENIFYGIYNLKVPLEMLEIENPAEILSNYFAAGALKRRNEHSNFPKNFLGLVNQINRYSYGNKKFSRLAHKFKKYFDNAPGKQRERLGNLEQNVKNRFVKSFFSPYRHSNKDNSFDYDFYDPNWDGKDKGMYVGIIYKELLALSRKAGNF